MSAPRFRRTRAFCAAFMLTVCVALFAGGFLLADVNSRAVAFGEGELPYAVEGGDHLRELASGQDVTAALLPARAQPFWWLLHGERALFDWLFGII